MKAKSLVKIFAVGAFFLVIGPDLCATEDFDAMTKVGAGWKEIVQKGIAAFLWFLSLFPLAVAGYFVFRMHDHIQKQEEQNQHEPKWMKNIKLLTAFVGGIVISFLGIGAFGSIFFNKNFTDSWTVFVTNFWNGVTAFM